MDKTTELWLKTIKALRRENEAEALMEEFLIESGGSYDMDEFDEWFKKRLYRRN